MNFICKVCEHSFNNILVNDHHIQPKELDGTDDSSNIAKLDPGCHQVLHYLAYRIFSSKGDAETIAMNYLKSINANDLTGAHDRLMNYSNKVSRFLLMAKNGELSVDVKKEKRIYINVSEEYKQLLKLFAKPQGLSKYIELLVLMHLKNKAPYLSDQINEDIIRKTQGLL